MMEISQTLPRERDRRLAPMLDDGAGRAKMVAQVGDQRAGLSPVLWSTPYKKNKETRRLTVTT
jgi:hypothetical protein